jgi:hypothetical protein
MTPADLAAMCALAGLQVVALTDHNTAGNCAAFLQAARRCGLLALPGMELCTREEVHVVCLFAELSGAQAFSDYVAGRLPPIQNKSHIFGRQLFMDSEDGVLGEETRLLAGATDLDLRQVPELVASYGGLAYPAHIDRPSNSLLSQLGLWDPDLRFPLAEVSPYCPPDLFDRADLKGLRHITGCDAHDLTAIPDAHQYMDLAQLSPQAVLTWLAGK